MKNSTDVPLTHRVSGLHCRLSGWRFPCNTGRLLLHDLRDGQDVIRMNSHMMHTPTGLMQALQCCFALGYNEGIPRGGLNRWFWIRVSPDSDT